MSTTRDGSMFLVLKDKAVTIVALVAVNALQLLMLALISVATVVLYVLFIKNLLAEAESTQSIDELLPAMQRSFAGVLTVVLGLELLETLRTYFVEHHVRLEVILVVAIIAVGRHVIQMDFGHTSGTTLLGLSALVAALTLGYFSLKRIQSPAKPGQS
jgi:uncharacterized membrane protein (DUF373 family)